MNIIEEYAKFQYPADGRFRLSNKCNKCMASGDGYEVEADS